ncbi:MAG: peroxiredoxin, partial [Bacteroidales bacterium]|nr:peroxiredoxin [Bacteroidales bacterium]
MKINLKTTLATAMAALALTACSHDGFTLEGTLDGGAGKNLWLEEIGPEGPLFIDSIPLDSKG